MEISTLEKKVLLSMKEKDIEVETILGIMVLLNKDWKQEDFLFWITSNPNATEDDIIGKAMGYGNLCMHCKNRFNPPKGFPQFCKAYPDGDGIPKPIQNEKWNHHGSCPGDNGIIFEPDEGYFDQE